MKGNIENIFSKSNIIAITWSPKLYVENINLQLRYTLPPIQQLRLCCDEYYMFPEFNLNGNLHWHGVINITDKVKWYKKVLPTFKHMGFVCIKQNVNKDWLLYITKDIELMCDIYNELDVELPITKQNSKQKRKVKVSDKFVPIQDEDYVSSTSEK